MIRFSTARMSQYTSLHSPAPALLALAFSLLATPLILSAETNAEMLLRELEEYDNSSSSISPFLQQALNDVKKISSPDDVSGDSASSVPPSAQVTTKSKFEVFRDVMTQTQLAQNSLGIKAQADKDLQKIFNTARDSMKAAQVAETEDDEAEDEEVEAAGFSVGRLNVHIDTGVQVLNPFTVSSMLFDAGTVQETRLLIADTGNRDVQGFTQISVNNRFAWQRRVSWQKIQKRAKETLKTTAYTPKSLLDRLSGVDPDVSGILNWLDFDLRLGVTYGRDEDSAQQIAESGEFFGSITAGLHLFSLWRSTSAEFRPDSLDDEGFYWSGLYLDGHAAMFTDSANGDIHHRVGVGPAFLLGILEDDKDVPLQVMFRTLFASVEALEGVGFRDDDIIIQSVNGEGFVPEYKSQFAVSLEAEVRYPFGNDLSALVGGRVDAFIDPNPWVLYIGASIPLSKFQSFFSGD